MIRSIQPADWSAIDAVQRACFPPSAIESRETLQSIADAAPELCAVAERDGVIVGYLLSHLWTAGVLPPLNEPLHDCPEHGDSLFIHDMALLPTARGGGLATEMVERALDTAREMGIAHASLLSVQKTTGFWNRFGFEEQPALTERFRAQVFKFYEIDFAFMTASLA